ncbi:MAG: aminoacyl-tRNA hydrolase [Myxococcales bacterium]|nr:aminoacyl-tRNA hydrolase [Myxococcales bacterium]
MVVGLGNPGLGYALTRHNVGFRIVERLAQACSIEIDEQRFGGRFRRGFVAGAEARRVEIGILQPATFMNRSGGAVQAAVRDLGIRDCERDLLVVFDDVDLPFGQLRVRAFGGAGGHRGLADVLEGLGELGVEEVPRLRFGVGRSESGGDTANYVLEPFSAVEESQLPERLSLAAEALLVALGEGIPAAMNRFNRAPEDTRERDADA